MANVSVMPAEVRQPGNAVLLLRYLRRNWSLGIGLLILFFLVAFTVIGFLTIDPKHAYPLAAPPRRPPGWPYLFGTDFFGRDLLAAMVVGMWQTALIGLIAGGIGTGVGVVLGFVSAYFGGWTDRVIKSVCQILTPIPALLIQVVAASSLDKRDVTFLTMALIVAALAWMWATLTGRVRRELRVVQVDGAAAGEHVVRQRWSTRPVGFVHQSGDAWRGERTASLLSFGNGPHHHGHG